jgi:hypothetical protein
VPVPRLAELALVCGKSGVESASELPFCAKKATSLSQKEYANSREARPIWNASVGGNYVVTPSMIDGEQTIHFVG